MMLKRKHTLMFLATGVCLGLITWFGMTVNTLSARQEHPKKELLTRVPKIKSCLEHIKLVSAGLENHGESQVAVLELENQAYVGVISISVETFADKAKHSVTWSGFSPDKEPIVVIPPQAKGKMRIGNLSSNSLIRIGSVMFSDGTEEGCENSKKEMRQLKENDTKKGGPKK